MSAGFLDPDRVVVVLQVWPLEGSKQLWPLCIPVAIFFSIASLSDVYHIIMDKCLKSANFSNTSILNTLLSLRLDFM